MARKHVELSVPGGRGAKINENLIELFSRLQSLNEDVTGLLNSVIRQDTFSGVTDSSGLYTVVFDTQFTVAPNIQVKLVGSETNQFVRVTAVSATGFTVHAFQRNTVNLLGVDLLLSATADINGANVDVIVTEK